MDFNMAENCKDCKWWILESLAPFGECTLVGRKTERDPDGWVPVAVSIPGWSSPSEDDGRYTLDSFGCDRIEQKVDQG